MKRLMTENCWSCKRDMTMTTHLFMTRNHNPRLAVSSNCCPVYLATQRYEDTMFALKRVWRASRQHMDNTPPSIISTYCDFSRVLYKQGSHLKVSLMKLKTCMQEIPPDLRRKKLLLHTSCELKPCRSTIPYCCAKAALYNLQLWEVSTT
jgi:hypothetical protein